MAFTAIQKADVLERLNVLAKQICVNLWVAVVGGFGEKSRSLQHLQCVDCDTGFQRCTECMCAVRYLCCHTEPATGGRESQYRLLLGIFRDAGFSNRGGTINVRGAKNTGRLSCVYLS